MKVPVCLVMASLCLAAVAQPPTVDTPEGLEAARHYAMSLIEKGQRLEAAEYLLVTLRSIPRDRADLVVPAIGAVQLLMFDHEYLMFDAERGALYEGALDEENHEMDLFLATLMRYSADTGMTQEEANACARDIQKLAYCDHLPARLAALSIMASPYYFYDTPMAQQARDILANDFPDTFPAKEAPRLALYRARSKGAAGLKEVLERKNDDGSLRSDTLRSQRDAIGGAIHTALTRGGDADAACVEALVAAARNAGDWADEYAALNILEGFHDGPQAAQVRQAMSEAIVRNTDPACTYRARVVRMAIARNQGDAEALLADAGALLKTSPIPIVAERNNYEELKNGIRHAAEFLAGQGRTAEARDLLEGLAARFPNTLLASQVEEALRALPVGEPVEN